MKAKFLNLGLIISSFLGYLEWGGNQSGFLIEMEWQVISSFIHNPMSALHPFTIIPFLGQLLLFITLFQKKPNRLLSLLGLGCLSLLLLLIFFIGLIEVNIRILASALPFTIIGIISIFHHRKKTT